MLAVSDAYKSAATQDVQSAFIRVEVGRFGIHAMPSGDAAADILATYYSDTVQSCTISGAIGDGGGFSIGSLVSHQCDLSIFTSAVEALVRNINSLDVRVSFGYAVSFKYDEKTETLYLPAMRYANETIDLSNYTVTHADDTLTLDTVEWHVKGVFAADKSLVTKNGLTTNITLYDAAYWLDTVGLSGEPFLPVGEADTLHNMVKAVCDEYGIALADDALTTLPNTTLYTYRPPAGCTVRAAIGHLAAAGFCNAVMPDNKLHFVRLSTTGTEITPADFQNIPSFDFCETVVDQITAEVTETFEYVGDPETEYKEPTVSIVKNSNSAVSDFPGNKRKGDKFILYIRGGGTNISDYDKATDAPWATVTYTGSGSYKGKSLLDIYNAGKLMGVYIGSGVHGVGRNAFNLKRYNNKVYFRGGSTYYFANDGYGSPSFYSGTKLYGSSKGNVLTDWEAISEEKGEDQTYILAYPADREDGADNNVIEFDPALFAGGTVNSLKDDGALMEKVRQDFAAIGKNSNLPFTYYGGSIEMFGRDFFSLGDVLNITDVYGEKHNLYAMNASYSFAGGIGSVYSSEGMEADVAAGSYAGTGSTASRVDKVEKEVEEVADKTDEAIEKAEEVIADANLAASLGDEAYDIVYPITSAMRTLLANAISEADKAAEGVLDEMQYTYVAANDFANAKAEFKSSNYRSAVRWTSTYTEEYDAWASDDAATQATIAAAKAKLDAANAALDTAYENEATAEADVASSMNELVRRIKALDKGKSDKKSISSQLAAAKENLASLKKNKKSKAKTIAAAQKLVNELQAKYDTAVSDITTLEANLAEAIYAVFGADGMSDVSGMIDQEAYDACAKYFADSTWLAGMQSSYGDGSRAALVVAETTVANAEHEVDVAIEGIHGVRTTTIQQTAEKVNINATKVEGLETKTAELEVTAEQISASVEDKASKSYVQQKANEVTSTIEAKGYQTASQVSSTVSQTLNSWTFTVNDISGLSSYMSFTGTNGTGTLTLGGSSSHVVLGGSFTTLTLGGATSVVNLGNLKFIAADTGSMMKYGSSGAFVLVDSEVTLSAQGSSGGQLTVSTDGNVYCTGELNVGSPGTSTSAANCRLTTGSGPGYIRYATGSSRRFKHDIEDINADYLDPSLLYNLPVRQFIFNEDYIDADDDRQGLYIPGFIAEEVAEHYPIAADLDAVEREFDNWNERLIIPGMLKLIQDQKKMIDALMTRIDALEGK